LIFTVVGSRQYPFDRLLKKLDELYADGSLREPMFAQTGKSAYCPRNYGWKGYLSQEEFGEMIRQADLIISHAASGTVMQALRERKKVIVVPRLERYGEHVNDHQVQAARAYHENGYALAVCDLDTLAGAVASLLDGEVTLRPWINDDPLSIVKRIDRFIQETWKG